MKNNVQKNHSKVLSIILAGIMAVSTAAVMNVSAAQLPQETVSAAASVAPDIEDTETIVGLGETMSISYMSRSAAAFTNYTVKSTNPLSVKAWRYGSTVKFTGVNPGTANIVVKEKNTGAKDSVFVTVKDPVNPKLAKSSITMWVGNTNSVSYMSNSADLFRFYKITSSNSKVVAAARYGSVVRLTAKSAGTATVTVTACDGAKTSMKVTVKSPIVKPSIAIDSEEIAVGEAAQVSYMGKSAASFADYTVTSSNENIVKAVRYGSVVRYMGVGTGTANISVKERYSGATDSFTVTVRKAAAPKFNETEVVLEPNSEPVRISYMGASADKFSYYIVSSSNTNVAAATRYGSTVELTPVAEGEATITVTSVSGDSATLKVTVTNSTSKNNTPENNSENETSETSTPENTTAELEIKPNM